jgi:TatD DNase family protein
MHEMLYDTHCHLNHPQFEADLDRVLARMRDEGVGRCLVAGYDSPSSLIAAELSSMHEDVYAAAGVHPHDADSFSEDVERSLLSLLEHPKVVAVGEIGLDFHYNYSDQKKQFAALEAQLRIAQLTNKPVIFHCREAYEPLLEVLESAAPIHGVMHCWAGDKDQARKALDMGLYLGFGGMITFKNASEICDIVAMVPVDSLLLETDAPYLAPTPHRGKRNEPAYVRLVAERVAQIKRMTLEEVMMRTWENGMTLFHGN